MNTIKELDSTSTKIQEYLHMGTRPVGIKLIREGETVEGVFDAPGNRGTFCWFVHEASRGKNFTIVREDLNCKTAEQVLGFKKRWLAGIKPRIKEKVAAVRIGPVDGADVVMLVLNEEQAITLFNLVPEIKISVRKKRAVCGEGLASVYNTNRPTIALLCKGAKTDGGFEPGELPVTLPYAVFLELPARMNKATWLFPKAVEKLWSKLRD